MRLIDEDVLVSRDVAVEQIFQFSYRFEISMRHAKIAEHIPPRARIVRVQQVRRSNNKRASIQLLRKESRHVGFTESNHVGKKHTAVFVEDFTRAQDGFLLILQTLKAVWQANIVKFCRRIQFISELFVKKFQVKLVRREMGEWRAINDRILVRFAKINSNGPELVEFCESKFVVSACLKLHVEFEVIEKA